MISKSHPGPVFSLKYANFDFDKKLKKLSNMAKLIPIITSQRFPTLESQGNPTQQMHPHLSNIDFQFMKVSTIIIIIGITTLALKVLVLFTLSMGIWMSSLHNIICESFRLVLILWRLLHRGYIVETTGW